MITPMSETNWTLLWQVERDICFLYHELSEYTGIMGDLAYGSLYALPYWDFLDQRGPDIRDEERCFIRDGCLVMILAMTIDMLDGSGFYVADKIGLCRQAINRLEAEDERTQKLIRVVRLALDAAAQGQRMNQEMEELEVWVNYHYVYGYFRGIAAESQAEHQRLNTPGQGMNL